MPVMPGMPVHPLYAHRPYTFVDHTDISLNGTLPFTYLLLSLGRKACSIDSLFSVIQQSLLDMMSYNNQLHQQQQQQKQLVVSISYLVRSYTLFLRQLSRSPSSSNAARNTATNKVLNGICDTLSEEEVLPFLLLRQQLLQCHPHCLLFS
jgi:hypothetical protein